MIKLIYKKIFIPKYLLKKSKLILNSLKIYYKYLKITPFLNWTFLEVYIGNKYRILYINIKKIGYRINDLLFFYNKNIYYEKYI